jgi:hypothetical protein
MTKRNAVKSRRSRGPAPGYVATGQQELLQITLGTPSGTFVGGQIPLIPTFEPTSRLGVLALQYSQYSIEGSRVSYVPQTTTGTSGRLALAWTFDTVDADPVNTHQVLQVSQAKSSALWKNFSTKMKRNSPEKRRFAVIDAATFTGLTSQDKQIYTPGTLIYGSDGSAQSGLTVGSLIWHYRIRFYNPNVQTGVVSFRTIHDYAVHHPRPASAPPTQQATPQPDSSPLPQSDDDPGHASMHAYFCKLPYCKYHYFY